MQSVLGNVKVKKKKISIGYILLILAVIIFAIRAVGVINGYRERGAYAYVQLLNYCMPIVETQVYDESEYIENQISVKRVVAEALGLINISTLGIVSNELTIFNGLNQNLNYNNSYSNISDSIFSPFKLKETSIARLTNEQIEQLNSVSAAYDPTLKKVLDKSNPEILIYHTHTHEGYSEVGGSSDDSNFTVVGVADVLAKELEENYGIAVVHDTTVHDVPYTGCYLASRETLQNYLNNQGGFKLIIDLHRDSAPKTATSVTLNNEDLARFMYVTAQNSPNYSANRALADKFVSITESLFPGILRSSPIYEYEYGNTEGFNMGLNENMILLEMGSNFNNAQEAKLSAKYVARVIAEYINGEN